MNRARNTYHTARTCKKFVYSIASHNNKIVWLSNMADTFVEKSSRYVGFFFSWLCFSETATWYRHPQPHLGVSTLPGRVWAGTGSTQHDSHALALLDPRPREYHWDVCTGSVACSLATDWNKDTCNSKEAAAVRGASPVADRVHAAIVVARSVQGVPRGRGLSHLSGHFSLLWLYRRSSQHTSLTVK